MKIVGLTGGIGSGKSTVAKLFIELGVPVYFADENAKRLMRSSKIVREKLIQEFGKKVFVNGELNRPYLAKVIFNNKEKLAAINAIVHPSVKNSFKRWIGKQKSNYILQENAILFENGTYSNFDFIITVIAPIEARIERVIHRDNVKRHDVVARINNQLPDKFKVKKSHFIINNLNILDTKKQVLKIHKKLISS